MADHLSVLVCGAAGYLGQHLVASLESWGHKIRVLIRVESRHCFQDQKAVEVRYWDTQESLTKAMKGIDVVINLAGPDSADCNKDPASAKKTVTVINKALLDASTASQVHTYLYVSSIHVYGSSPQGEVDIDHELRPDTPYGMVRKAGEDIVLAYPSNLNKIIVRLSNGYGFADINFLVNSSRNLFVNQLILGAVQNWSINLKSNPNILRDFIPITEASKLICELIMIPPNLYPSDKHIINLCSGKTYRLIDMAILVQKYVLSEFRRNLSINVASTESTGEIVTFRYSNHSLRRFIQISKISHEEHVFRSCELAFKSC